MDGEFEAFCRRAWPRLVAALTHYTGDPGLAEELVQEALIRAGDRWGRVGQLASPEGWAFRVAANLARSHFRRRAAERRAVRRHGPPREAWIDAAEVVAVRDAIRELPDRQRQAVVLRYYLDLTPDEVGQIMGISGQAVRNLTHRGMRALRDRLQFVQEVTDVS